MVALNQTVGKQIPNELILFQLLSIFGDQLHICPETQTCMVCSKDLSPSKFAPGEKKCRRCDHLLSVAAYD